MNYVICGSALLCSCFAYKKRNEIILLAKILKNYIQEKTENKIEPSLNNNKQILELRCLDHKIVLPYNDLRSVEMIYFDVKGYDRDGYEYELTQSPGIPYMFSAHMLGLERIEVFNQMNHEKIIYDNDKIIGYCDEIL